MSEKKISAGQPVVCTFESRRAAEMRSLIERFGATAVVAPSMQEVPLEENSITIDAVRQIVSGGVSSMILLTGVGTEAMLQIAAIHQLEQPLLDAMKLIPLLVRGPKPAAVLKRLGLNYTVKAAEPNTWVELLQAIDSAHIDLHGQFVAVQEYGVPNPELYSGLESRGASVLAVPVYRWALPDNIEPLQNAIRQTIAQNLQALLFTSAQQVRHVLTVADEMQCREQWLRAANQIAIASIGPTCSEALREHGLNVSFEASPPKMGPLVRGIIEQLGNSSS